MCNICATCRRADVVGYARLEGIMNKSDIRLRRAAAKLAAHHIWSKRVIYRSLKLAIRGNMPLLRLDNVGLSMWNKQWLRMDREERVNWICAETERVVEKQKRDARLQQAARRLAAHCGARSERDKREVYMSLKYAIWDSTSLAEVGLSPPVERWEKMSKEEREDWICAEAKRIAKNA